MLEQFQVLFVVRPRIRDRCHATDVTDEAADHAMMEMFRRDIIGVQAIAHVDEQWQRPVHDWRPKTGGRLFNAATHALTGKVVENPKGTAPLHQVIDRVCGIAA
jgi:hypothetical protein